MGFFFFEGTEKKLELEIHPSQNFSFRNQPFSFWTDVVQKASAKILSKKSDTYCDAYLLSESSLFVWDQRLVMITCGRTALVKAVKALLNTIPKSLLAMLFYERKRENFSYKQPTHFLEDIQSLSKMISGKAYRFGELYKDYLSLFHLDQPHQPQTHERTFEILLHGIHPKSQALFQNGSDRSLEKIHTQTKITQLLDHYQTDAHLFTPQGYSLNAFSGPFYYTVHVTPEREGSYVSFETNQPDPQKEKTLMMQLLEIFQPQAFDLVWFLPKSAYQKHVSFSIPSYLLRQDVRSILSNHYGVLFQTYERPFSGIEKPFQISNHLVQKGTHT